MSLLPYVLWGCQEKTSASTGERVSCLDLQPCSSHELGFHFHFCSAVTLVTVTSMRGLPTRGIPEFDNISGVVLHPNRCNKSVFLAFFLQRGWRFCVTGTRGYFVRYGYVAVPLWVFAQQMGIPIPAAPILLAAGAIAATSRMSLPFLTALALTGALTADLIWYRVGYAHGSRALGRLCRVCLEPDSCLRRVKNLLEKHGLRSLHATGEMDAGPREPSRAVGPVLTVTGETPNLAKSNLGKSPVISAE